MKAVHRTLRKALVGVWNPQVTTPLRERVTYDSDCKRGES
jgi:hypothetical protein